MNGGQERGNWSETQGFVCFFFFSKCTEKSNAFASCKKKNTCVAVYY